MPRKRRFQHRILSDINSSFTVFFFITTLVWSQVFSGYFPKEFQATAFYLCILFSLVLYTFRFMLDQFYESVTVLRLITLYFFLSAGMAFLSAVKGPIADGEIPVIRFLFLGPYVYSDAVPSVIVASVFTFYGTVTLLMSLITSAILEFSYNLTYRLLPKSMKRQIADIDNQIDTVSFKTSYRLFLTDSRKGIAIVTLLLFLYTAAYIFLLIMYSD
jgi:hypothetical protein